MKPEDLMLGNYLHDKLTGELLEVSVLTKKHIHTRLLDQTKYPLPDGWQATYIPVNVTWLRSLGFRHKWEMEYLLNDVGLVFLMNGRCKVYLTGRYIATITHVHELQNIYFLLTKEKLTLTK